MNISKPADIINNFMQSGHLDFKNSINLAKLCSIYLAHEDTEPTGREIIIRVLDAWDKLDRSTHFLWNDIVEASGLYPYVIPTQIQGSSQLRYEFHRSKHLRDVYLHREQNDISLDLLSKKSIVVSAPTSFGKSLLIEEIVASKTYNSIVVVQPTLALLDETRKKLLNYSDDYRIIVSTSQLPSSELRNTFLFTPERVVEYENFSSVDFFVIDEFYKLSLDRKDDRGIILNQALHKLLGFTKVFYFLGPNVSDVPTEFRERYNFRLINTKFSTVAVDEYPMLISSSRAKEENQLKLFELLTSLDEPTMVYCQSQPRTMELTENFVHYLASHKLLDKYATNRNDDIAEWIRLNIHEKWILITALQNSIACHHGSLPRHLGSSIVDAFNTGCLRHLFCTSTLIEGVNTSAKNVVLFDKMKGTNKLDYFDYRNISGRSGRMGKHFIGRVYNFHPQPAVKDQYVDIPIITQDNAPLELLIQIDKTQLKKSSIEKMREFDNLNEDFKAAIQKNHGIPVQGQIELVNDIEGNLTSIRDMLQWSGPYPEYEQLTAVIDLAWKHLRTDKRASHNISSPKQLVFLARKYARIQSIGALIKDDINSPFWSGKEPDFERRVNMIVFRMLDIGRHWFDFKLPKLLATVSTLQNYILTKHNYKPGDYSFFANTLERGNFPPNVATLLDYNVPSSAITKIIRHIKPDESPESVLKMLAKSDLKSFGLIPYEIDKIKAVFRRKIDN